MYSDKINIAILTALLRDHGVRHAVVCPGSRNAAIVNNLVICPDIECHAATDERSAAFEAMGIALATEQPTVVCVTSGSALLNTLPAVAEAWYQHVPLIVVSADRPSAWINQLDGQTIDQPGALERWCCLSVNLPEVKEIIEEKDYIDHWNCNWLVNKALIAAAHHSRPVHINVPLSEPLYEFKLKELPEERVVRERTTEDLLASLARHKKIMLVAGQNRHLPSLAGLSSCCAVVAEPLAWCDCQRDCDSIYEQMEYPDMVIYLGGTIVNKNIKKILRMTHSLAECWYISTDGEIADTFMNLGNVVFTNDLENIVKRMNEVATEHSYAEHWNISINKKREDSSLEEMIVRELEELTEGHDCNFIYANSMAVRYACHHARHNIFCNRGVNGIEGTISTALGIARGSDKTCICVTGDLSFFYDCNALWRNDLPSNLRIIVLNNGGGKIFERFDGLNDNAAKPFVTGAHDTSCRGICESYGIAYAQVRETGVIDQGLLWLVTDGCAALLEIKIEI